MDTGLGFQSSPRSSKVSRSNNRSASEVPDRLPRRKLAPSIVTDAGPLVERFICFARNQTLHPFHGLRAQMYQNHGTPCFGGGEPATHYNARFIVGTRHREIEDRRVPLSGVRCSAGKSAGDTHIICQQYLPSDAPHKGRKPATASKLTPISPLEGAMRFRMLISHSL